MVIKMEFRLGNSRWVHQRGETVSIICPECKKKVMFGVLSIGNFDLKPLKELKSEV